MLFVSQYHSLKSPCIVLEHGMFSKVKFSFFVNSNFAPAELYAHNIA